MKTRRDITIIISLYLIAILYVILLNDIFGTVVFLIILTIFHIYGFTGEKDKLYLDKEDSLLRLMSKLKKTKKENEDAYKRFISLTKTFGSGVIMVNEEGIINFTNKDFKEYFNIENINKDYNSLVKIKPLYKFINQAYLLENSSREQIQYQDKFYDLISTPIFENKFFQGCLIIVHDITSLKTAENFQKQFTADVSHELKTPLSSIKGFAEILVHDKEIKDKDRDEFIKLINKESTRMEAILKDLLIISKMDRLDYELTVKKVNIKDLINKNIDLVKHLINKKDIILKVDIDDYDLEIDKNKIGQVILNLVGNAINYTDKGEICIKGKLAGNYYSIKVIDTGIGINKQNIDKIFKRFYRVNNARSRESGGSGLGLSICKNVVLKHGGKIFVDSIKKQGTTFEILLPIKK